MFYSGSGAALHVNCSVSPNSDVSGIGVRISLYIQAVIMIILSNLNNKPQEIFLSNLSLQIPSLALLSSAYFDTAIDVPHTLIAIHFSVLLSACRMSVHDLPVRYLGSTRSMKVTSRIAVVDVVFRWFLVVFNFVVWSSIVQLQGRPEVCPDGFGQWYFFRAPVPLNRAGSAITFAYICSILDIPWEAARLLIGFFRGWEMHPTTVEERFQWNIDSRQWIVANLLYSARSRCFRTIIVKDQYMQQVCKFLRRTSILIRTAFLIFSIVAIEKTITLNNLQSTENRWAFGQIFAMINTFALLSQCILIISRNSNVKPQEVWVIFGQILGLALFFFMAYKGTAYQWELHERAWPGVFDNMRWYQYPIEMFCFSGALFMGVMWALMACGCAYMVLLGLCGVGLLCVAGMRRLVPMESREAVFQRVCGVTQPLRYALGLGEMEDDIEENARE